MKRVLYTQHELYKAYRDWEQESEYIAPNVINFKKRILWCIYCDIRDGLAIGTNQKKQSRLFNINVETMNSKPL